jgi:hypothetical protein
MQLLQLQHWKCIRVGLPCLVWSGGQGPSSTRAHVHKPPRNTCAGAATAPPSSRVCCIVALWLLLGACMYYFLCSGPCVPSAPRQVSLPAGVPAVPRVEYLLTSVAAPNDVGPNGPNGFPDVLQVVYERILLWLGGGGLQSCFPLCKHAQQCRVFVLQPYPTPPPAHPHMLNRAHRRSHTQTHFHAPLCTRCLPVLTSPPPCSCDYRLLRPPHLPPNRLQGCRIWVAVLVGRAWRFPFSALPSG